MISTVVATYRIWLWPDNLLDKPPKTAAGMVWLVLDSPQISWEALHLFQKHLLYWENIHSFSHHGCFWNSQKIFCCAGTMLLLLPVYLFTPASISSRWSGHHCTLTTCIKSYSGNPIFNTECVQWLQPHSSWRTAVNIFGTQGFWFSQWSALQMQASRMKHIVL
jgi:hypothetical protein